MRRKISILMLLLVYSMNFTACDMDSKAKLKAQQKLEEEKKLKETQEKYDILFKGKVSNLKAAPDFAGSKFISTECLITKLKNKKVKFKFEFDNETNSCKFDEFPHMGLVHTAEYTIKDGKIIFDSTKYSMLMATLKYEDWEVLFKKKLSEASEEEIEEFMESLKGGPKDIEEFFKLVRDCYDKEHKIFENWNKVYAKYPPLEGEISADKKTITIKKFVIPNWYEIVEFENLVFTRE
ncbi:hypothetical protein [Treponema putidum]|uniref:hypothetical protein n=1 Tax=Treponema putidum TaxID=221027 RepID=UPI002106E783|nr:hypothetical protein [Treponema putidum]UTY31744.1 hypothetical protein E4N75_09800 [Treponema putidum]